MTPHPEDSDERRSGGRQRLDLTSLAVELPFLLPLVQDPKLVESTPVKSAIPVLVGVNLPWNVELPVWFLPSKLSSEVVLDHS